MSQPLSVLLALALAFPAFCQTHIVFSPSTVPHLPAVVWSVVACVDPEAPAVTLRQGELFQMLALHGAKPLTNSETLALLHRKDFNSWPTRLIRWPAYLAAGSSFFLTTDVVTVSAKTKAAVGAAAGFLMVLSALVQKNLPAPPAIEAELTGSWIPVSAGGCANGVLLGGSGVAFEVDR